MIRRTFIRGLWGVSEGDCQSPKLQTRTWQQIKSISQHYPPVQPVINYVFGERNAEVYRSLDIPFTMLSREPVVNWRNSTGERDHRVPGREFGRLAWGLSLWRHKLECIREAFKSHDEVVWIDWDCKLINPIPANFWERLRQGQPFQAQLYRYKNLQLGWRKTEGEFVCHGAFLYFRDPTLVERAIKIHEEQFPTCTDEIALSKLVEEMMGGRWLGGQVYYDLGYAPFCYANRKSVRLPDYKDMTFIETFYAWEIARHYGRAEEWFHGPKARWRKWLEADAAASKHRKERKVRQYRSSAPPPPKYITNVREALGAKTERFQERKPRVPQTKNLSPKPRRPPTVAVRFTRDHLVDGVKMEAGKVVRLAPPTAAHVIKAGFAHEA